MAQLTWKPSGLDPSVVATNVTAGKTTLSVRVTRAGGVNVVEQEGEVYGVPCWDGVEAEVEVEAVSADGALAETARGIVFTESTAWASIDVLLPRPPMGSLRIDAAPASLLRYKSLILSLEFSLGPPYGGLDLILGYGTGAVDSGTLFPVATFSPLTTAAAAPR